MAKYALLQYFVRIVERVFMIKENQKLFNRLNVISDAAVSLVAVVISYLLVFNLLVFDRNYPLIDYIKLALVFIPIQLITYGCMGLYDSFRTSTFGRELWRIFQAFLMDGMIIIAMLYIVKIFNFSRLALAIFLVLDFIIIALKRFILRNSLKRFRSSGYNKKHVVIIGGGQTAAHYLDVIREETQMGFECAGYIADTDGLDAKRLGSFTDIFNVLDKRSYSEVVCALDAEETVHLGDAVEACELTGTKISVIPSIYKYMTTSPSFDVVGGIPMMNIRRIPLDNIGNAFMKRAMDIIGSLVLLILSSPVMLVSAIVIKATMGGKVIFRQQRVGLNKKIFTMYKLKSMKDNDTSDTAWSTDNDPRKTRFGAFIRKFSIDELPQLFNVLKGDMSLVGPRPELPFFVESFKKSIPMYMIKHQVKPGMTGLAQVRGFRGDTSIERRIECDIEYIESWNIFLDISILVKTALSGFMNSEKLNKKIKKTKPEKKIMKNETQKTDLTALAIFLPAVVALALIPTLMQVTLATSSLVETFKMFSATAAEDGTYLLIDIFSQCKAFAVVVFAIIMMSVALMCCVFLFRRVEKRTLVYTGASVVYVLMALFSALGSAYPEVAFFGAFDRAEGFYTTACYFVMFLFTMYAFRKTQNFSYIILALFICTGVNFIYGILQFTDNNLFQYDWFRSVFTDREYADMLQLKEESLGEGALYGALYHSNYVGSFTGMIIPLFTVLTLYVKPVWQKLLLIVFDLMAIFMLFGSVARSGIVAVAAAFVVGLIVFGRVLVRRWKITVSVVGAAAVVLVGANIITDNGLFGRIPSLFQDITELIVPAEDADIYSQLPVREIIHNKDGSVSLETQTDKLTISFDREILDYRFTDSAGNVLELEDDRGMITVSDEDFKDINFEFVTSDDELGYMDSFFMWFYDTDESALLFHLHNEKQIHMIDLKVGERILPVNAEHIGFEGKERIGSGRGYIWSRTLPLLKNCLITGYGADTFAYVFPQTDYLAKYYTYTFSEEYTEGFHVTIDKAHNLYLQIFVSNGLIALIAFLAICVFYIVDCFRLYALRKEYRIEQIYGISVMLGIIGYLAAGMFNDSVVSVAPVFWILLGTGAALNTINRRADRNEVVDVDDIAIAKKKAPVATAEELSDYEDRGRQLAESLINDKMQKKPAPNPTKADVDAMLEKAKERQARFLANKAAEESAAIVKDENE